MEYFWKEKGEQKSMIRKTVETILVSIGMVLLLTIIAMGIYSAFFFYG